MVRAGCVFVAGIHPSRTWTSGSFESVRWIACVHRLDLGLYSHPKEFFGGNGVWTHVNSKGKIPSTRKFPQRRTEPATLWRVSPNTTNKLFQPRSTISIILSKSISKSFFSSQFHSNSFQVLVNNCDRFNKTFSFFCEMLQWTTAMTFSPKSLI